MLSILEKNDIIKKHPHNIRLVIDPTNEMKNLSVSKGFWIELYLQIPLLLLQNPIPIQSYSWNESIHLSVFWPP